MLLPVYLTVMGVALLLSVVGWMVPATLLGGLGLLIAYRWHILSLARKVPRTAPIPAAVVPPKL